MFYKKGENENDIEDDEQIMSGIEVDEDLGESDVEEAWAPAAAPKKVSPP